MKEGLTPLLDTQLFLTYRQDRFTLRSVEERRSLSSQNLPPLPQGDIGGEGTNEWVEKPKPVLTTGQESEANIEALENCHHYVII